MRGAKPTRQSLRRLQARSTQGGAAVRVVAGEHASECAPATGGVGGRSLHLHLYIYLFMDTSGNDTAAGHGMGSVRRRYGPANRQEVAQTGPADPARQAGGIAELGRSVQADRQREGRGQ